MARLKLAKQEIWYSDIEDKILLAVRSSDFPRAIFQTLDDKILRMYGFACQHLIDNKYVHICDIEESGTWFDRLQ